MVYRVRLSIYADRLSFFIFLCLSPFFLQMDKNMSLFCVYKIL